MYLHNSKNNLITARKGIDLPEGKANTKMKENVRMKKEPEQNNQLHWVVI